MGRIRNYGMAGDKRRGAREDLGARFLLTRSPLEVYPGLVFSGEIDRVNAFEESGGVRCYTLDDEGRARPHEIADDVALTVNVEDRGLVIVTGCAHSGTINTVDHLRSISGVGEVEGMAGGFHLMHSGEDRIGETIERIRGFSPRWLAPMHCNGLLPTASMATAFPDSFAR